MNFRDIVQCICLLIIIFYAIKSYILKVGLTHKDKILLTYTPRYIFLGINILFIISSLNMIYVIFMKPSAVYQDWSHYCMTGILFIWLSICVLGRGRYLKATKQEMKEVYFYVLVLISYASFLGFLYFI